jgi:hypothetical protein
VGDAGRAARRVSEAGRPCTGPAPDCLDDANSTRPVYRRDIGPLRRTPSAMDGSFDRGDAPTRPPVRAQGAHAVHSAERASALILSGDTADGGPSDPLRRMRAFIRAQSAEVPQRIDGGVFLPSNGGSPGPGPARRGARCSSRGLPCASGAGLGERTADPARKRVSLRACARRMLHARPARRYLLAATLAAPVLLGCGSSGPLLKIASVERAIAASILAQHHLRATVSCPPDVPQRTGVAFTCTAALDVGSYQVPVTQTNGSGHVRYENAAPLAILDSAAVEHAIRQSIRTQRHLDSAVTCPPEVIQKAGTAFTCTAMLNRRPSPFSVTELDAAGHVRYVGR